MQKSDKIFVAGHRGLVGSALLRKLEREGFANIVTRDRSQLSRRDAIADARVPDQIREPDGDLLGVRESAGMPLRLGQQLAADPVAQVRAKAQREQLGHQRCALVDRINVSRAEHLLWPSRRAR